MEEINKSAHVQEDGGQARGRAGKDGDHLQGGGLTGCRGHDVHGRCKAEGRTCNGMDGWMDGTDEGSGWVGGWVSRRVGGWVGG